MMEHVYLKDWRRRPERGEWEPIKILMQELTYVPGSNHKVKTLQESDEHTNEQHRNYPLKVMNAAEKELNQLDTRLERYDQNSEQTLLLKLPDGHVRPWTGHVRFRQICPVNEPDMSGLPRNFLPNIDS
jgi:ribosomal protein S4